MFDTVVPWMSVVGIVYSSVWIELDGGDVTASKQKYPIFMLQHFCLNGQSQSCLQCRSLHFNWQSRCFLHFFHLHFFGIIALLQCPLRTIMIIKIFSLCIN